MPQRVTTMQSQWAKEAYTNIPTPPVSGLAFRNTDLSNTVVETGQAYDRLADSATWNQVLYEITGLLMDSEKYGILPYSQNTNYPQYGLAMDTDGDGTPNHPAGTIYRALLPSGPAYGGAVPMYDEQSWAVFVTASGGGGGNGFTYCGIDSATDTIVIWDAAAPATTVKPFAIAESLTQLHVATASGQYGLVEYTEGSVRMYKSTAAGAWGTPVVKLTPEVFNFQAFAPSWYNATAMLGAVYWFAGNYLTLDFSVDIASTSKPGIIQVDGVTAYMSGNTLKVPVAKDRNLGLVTPDGSSVYIDSSGVLHAASTGGFPGTNVYTLPAVTSRVQSFEMTHTGWFTVIPTTTSSKADFVAELFPSNPGNSGYPSSACLMMLSIDHNDDPAGGFLPVSKGQWVRLRCTTGDLRFRLGILQAAATDSSAIIPPDGVTIIKSSNTLKAVTATDAKIGMVKPDGTTIVVNASGTLTATAGSGATPPDENTIKTVGGVLVATTATNAQLGIVKPDGDTIKIVSGALAVPKATAQQLGAVRVDNTTITVNNDGVITSAGGGGGTPPDNNTIKIVDGLLVAQPATVGENATAGIVKPDGETININGNGQLYALTGGGGSGYEPDTTTIDLADGKLHAKLATSTTPGIMYPDGDMATVDADGKLTIDCPIATAFSVGTVQPDGDTMAIDTNGIITPKIATSGTAGKAGIVKPDGTSITVQPNGTISAAAYSLPIATSTRLGGVKVDTSTINITDAGVISAVGGGGGGVPFAGSTRTSLTVPTQSTPTIAVAPQDCWSTFYARILNSSEYGNLHLELIVNGETKLVCSAYLDYTSLYSGVSLPVKQGQTIRATYNASTSLSNAFFGWVFPDTTTGGAGSSIEPMVPPRRPYKLSDIPIWIEYKSDLEYAIENFYSVAAITIEVLLNDAVGAEKREEMGLTVAELQDMQRSMGIS